jgi:trafficking protein particle complex subunit 10
LTQYDDLSSTFQESFLSNSLSFFPSLLSSSSAHPTPEHPQTDDSAPLLDTTKKPYRDYILANAISIFDFRTYLFARQCELAGRRMGEVEEALRRGTKFVSGMGRMLMDSEVSLLLFP